MKRKSNGDLDRKVKVSDENLSALRYILKVELTKFTYRMNIDVNLNIREIESYIFCLKTGGMVVVFTETGNSVDWR